MKNRLLAIFLILSLLLSVLPSASGASQSTTEFEVENILRAMSPAERVGQLFLIPFEGTSVTEGSDIYDLITNYHIGGVVLSAERDNFVEEETVTAAWRLIQQLQQANWNSKLGEGNVNPNQLKGYVPLYVGMSLVRSDNRTAQILSGLTQYPSPMSIGATWSSELAQEVGAVIGQELSALGVNLFLGPGLDVVDSKDSVASSFANTQSFGGDPYWVGELGKAYVQGIHQGSQNRISVIAQHFPGLGSVDRPPYDEVSTIQKTLDQLEQIELAPYFSLTGDDDPQRQVDGLMISACVFRVCRAISARQPCRSISTRRSEQLLSPQPLASGDKTVD